MEITAEYFEQATGQLPQDDDLERCNCQQAGEAGHFHCGWNSELNRPVFFGGGLDFNLLSSGYYKVKL